MQSSHFLRMPSHIAICSQEKQKSEIKASEITVIRYIFQLRSLQVIALYWCQLTKIKNTQSSRPPFPTAHWVRFPKLWIAIYYLIKGRQTAANHRNNLSIENLTRNSAKSKTTIRSTNRNFKSIKNVTKILHVLPHLKCWTPHAKNWYFRICRNLKKGTRASLITEQLSEEETGPTSNPLLN